MFEGKKHFEKTNSKHRSPLWKPFSGCVTAIAETIRGWFPARRSKKKHALNLNAPSSLSMFGIFGICFVKPHDCQFLIHPASIYILCSEYWVAFCWALHCPCSNFYPLVGMPWRPTVEQPEFFLPWAGFGAQPSAIYIYICIRYAYNTPPHATPCHPNVRPKACKTLPPVFRAVGINYYVAFPQIHNAPTYHNKTTTAETSAEHRDEATTRTGGWRYGVWIQLRRLEMSRGSVVVLGEGQVSKCLSPKPLNQWLGKRFTLGQSTGSCLCHLDFPLQACLFSTKKQDQSQCVFSDPAPTTQCAHSKAGAGYFGRFGTPWTVYKTKSDHSSDLVFSHFTLGDFALSGTDGSVPAPRLGSCLETLVEGYRINTWRVKGFESVHTLPFNAQHFQGSCSLSVCPHRSPQMSFFRF